MQQTAKADSVVFSTSGLFTGTGASGASLVLPGSPTGVTTLAYTSATSPVGLNSSPFANVQLGSFLLTSSSPNLESPFANDSFTLTINQTTPGGVGTSSANIVGIVNATSGGEFAINFTPTTIDIGPAGDVEAYILSLTTTPFGPNGISINLGQTTTINATLIGPAGSVSTPLPKSLYGGVGLFGMLGVVGSRRRSSLT